jgi:hypothetical protein
MIFSGKLYVRYYDTKSIPAEENTGGQLHPSLIDELCDV